MSLVGIRGVLYIHSIGAAFSGWVALLYPPFFGAVFHSLTAEETLIMIERIYSVLVFAQAFLLVGLRKIKSVDCLRRASAVYCVVFSLTTAVAWRASFQLGLTEGLSSCQFLVWMSMAAPYGYLAVNGTSSQIKTFMHLHGAVAGCAGLAGILFPIQLTQTCFLSPQSMGHYETLSQYYGSLICGMSLLTFLLTQPDAAAARGTAGLVFACVFAASAFILFNAMSHGTAKSTFLEGNTVADFAGAFSVLMFVGLALLYTATNLSAAYDTDVKKSAKSKAQ